jgi:hypothetical protein
VFIKGSPKSRLMQNGNKLAGFAGFAPESGHRGGPKSRKGLLIMD